MFESNHQNLLSRRLYMEIKKYGLVIEIILVLDLHLVTLHPIISTQYWHKGFLWLPHQKFNLFNFKVLS